MKKVIIGLVGLCSCVPGNSPVRVVDIFPPDPMCGFQDDVGQYSGLLDASGPGGYNIIFRVLSELNIPGTKDNLNRDLTTAGQANFITDEMVLSYTSKNPTVVFETERVAMVSVVEPGAPKDLLLQIIGPKAAVKLRDNVTDTTADPKMTLIAKVEIRGHTEGGTTMPINAINFPLTVYTTNTTCTMGQAPPGGNCILPGQDGQAVACCVAPGMPAGCP